MTITLADYSTQQEAKNNIANAVLGHTYALCEALRENYIKFNIRCHQKAIDRIVDGSDYDGRFGTKEYHIACIDDLQAGNCGYEFYPETGRKYHKVIMSANGSRSVHCFIDKNTGEIYKSASFKSPAKNVRYDLRLIKDREFLLEKADWSGNYLYSR
jgi:hypothetical protein